MEVSGNPVVLVSLSPWENLQYPLNRSLNGLQSQSGSFWISEKSLINARIQILDHQACSLITILTVLSWLALTCCED
jgi:hypothetical protein